MKRTIVLLPLLLGCATTAAPAASDSTDQLAAREAAYATHGGEDGGSCRVDGEDAPMAATAAFFDVLISEGGEPSFGINLFGAEGEAAALVDDALNDHAPDLLACVDRVEDRAALSVVRSGDGELQLGEHSLKDAEAECIVKRLQSGLDGITGIRLDPLTFRFGLPRGEVEPGVLPNEAIGNVISENRGDIGACYESVAAGWPGMEGKVTVTFMVLPNGDARAIGVADSDVDSGPVECCILDAVSGWKFPEPEGGGVVVVNYGFALPPSRAQ